MINWILLFGSCSMISDASCMTPRCSRFLPLSSMVILPTISVGNSVLGLVGGSMNVSKVSLLSVAWGKVSLLPSRVMNSSLKGFFFSSMVAEQAQQSLSRFAYSEMSRQYTFCGGTADNKVNGRASVDFSCDVVKVGREL